MQASLSFQGFGYAQMGMGMGLNIGWAGGLEQLMGLQRPGGFGMGGCFGGPQMMSPQAMMFRMMSAMMMEAMSCGIPNFGSCPGPCFGNHGLPNMGWAFPGGGGFYGGGPMGGGFGGMGGGFGGMGGGFGGMGGGFGGGGCGPMPFPGPQPFPFPGPRPRPMPGPGPRPMPGPRPRPMPGPGPRPMPGPRPRPMPGPGPGPGPCPGPRPTPGPGPSPKPEPQPLNTDQITKFLNDGKYKEAFGKLNEQQQKQFIGVMEQSQFQGMMSKSMTSLLESGKLTQADKQGGPTVLDALDRLANQPLQKGVNRRAALTNVAAAVNDFKTFNQDGQGTCTVTAMGREHARTMPADFARVNADLLTKGETTGQDGRVIPLAAGDLGRNDNTGRNQVERAYQDAMMEFGNGKDATYDAANDCHRSQEGTGQTGRDLGGGLSGKELARVTRSVLGRDVEAKNFARWNLDSDQNKKLKTDDPSAYQRRVDYNQNKEKEARAQFPGDFQKFKDKDQMMQVSMKWSAPGEKHSSHKVNVSKIENGYVYLDNPWGDSDKGQGAPPREVVGRGGSVRMKLDEFYDRLQGYESYRSKGGGFLSSLPPIDDFKSDRLSRN